MGAQLVCRVTAEPDKVPAARGGVVVRKAATRQGTTVPQRRAFRIIQPPIDPTCQPEINLEINLRIKNAGESEKRADYTIVQTVVKTDERGMVAAT
jgi:hypothetical protein